MINNYNANQDTPQNRELLNHLFRIQLIKDRFYVPSNIQPQIFRHDLNFGKIKEGEGSARSQSQFNLEIGDMGGGYSVGGSSLRSNGTLVSHEMNYLVDEMERGHPLRSTPFLGKRGEHSEATGLIRRPEMTGAGLKKGVTMPRQHPKKIKALGFFGEGMQEKKVKPLAIKKVKSSPMKKLTGQFSILNKVI